MSTKTISIRDDVHKRLVEAKRQDESFSDVIDRLLKKENADLSVFFGSLKNSDLLDEIEEDSKRMRASSKI
jgi:predicted CopG family antitoxin